MGCFSFNGNLDTCNTIRTALHFPYVPHPACGHPLPLPQARENVQAGGGWVNDSEAEAEFQKTVNKSKAMLKAVALAETFGAA